jgi:hypothetical protein
MAILNRGSDDDPLRIPATLPAAFAEKQSPVDISFCRLYAPDPSDAAADSEHTSAPKADSSTCLMQIHRLLGDKLPEKL